MTAVDAPDLKATTLKAKIHEEVALNLGRGDGEALLDAGLMARSNAAMAKLNGLQSRKDKDKQFEDLMYEHLRQSLDAINAEMDWLEDQIKIEEKAIQENNTEIDFIRTLNEGNVMGADGTPSDDVKALLKKYGHDDLDDKGPDEIMHMLETIETNLHSDNYERESRIDGYQQRHGKLREHAGQIAKKATGALKQEADALAAREPYEVKTRLVAEAHTAENKDWAAAVELQTVDVRNDIATPEFGF